MLLLPHQRPAALPCPSLLCQQQHTTHPCQQASPRQLSQAIIRQWIHIYDISHHKTSGSRRQAHLPSNILSSAPMNTHATGRWHTTCQAASMPPNSVQQPHRAVMGCCLNPAVLHQGSELPQRRRHGAALRPAPTPMPCPSECCTLGSVTCTQAKTRVRASGYCRNQLVSVVLRPSKGGAWSLLAGGTSPGTRNTGDCSHSLGRDPQLTDKGHNWCRRLSRLG